MIDQNRDGFIDHEDLKDMLASLGELTGTLVGWSPPACFHNEIILWPPSFSFSPPSLPPPPSSHRSGTQW